MTERQLIIIANSLEPYLYEAVNVVGYPQGLTYRVRFSSKWVQEAVQATLAQTIGLKGLYIFRDTTTARLYPLRWLSVTSALQIGDIFYFEFTLCDLIDFSSNSAERQRQVDQFNNSFATFNSDVIRQNSPQGTMSPLIFWSAYETKISNEHAGELSAIEKEMVAWANAVNLLAGTKHFPDVPFIKPISLSPIDSKIVEPIWAINGLIAIRANSTNALRVLHLIPDLGIEIHEVEGKRPAGYLRSAPYELHLTSPSKCVIVTRGFQRAAGRYDVLTFLLNVSSNPRDRTSILTLEYTVPDAVRKHLLPMISLPVSIAFTYRGLVPRTLLATLFAAATVAPEAIHTVTLLPETLVKFAHDAGLVGLSITIMETITYLRQRMRGE